MMAGLLLVIGVALLVMTWLSALRAVLVPRQRTSSMMLFWTHSVRILGLGLGRHLRGRSRERLLELCSPLALTAAFLCWTIANVASFLLMAPALTGQALFSGATTQFVLVRSESSADLVATACWLSVAGLFALFTLHLARVCGAYSRRELGAARVFMPAYRPAEAEFFLAGHLRSGSWEHVDGVFERWAEWFADIKATHVGYPVLTYYRPATDRCWLDAAVLVLDAAALTEALAPAWSPPGVRAVLDAGCNCLPVLVHQLGVDLPRTSVSLQGREEREFEQTVRVAVVAGLPQQRDYAEAWVEFQRWRTRYAPYVAAIRRRLLYTNDPADIVGGVEELPVVRVVD